MPSKNVVYHIVAFVIVMVWGGTFVNSKVLLLNGMRAEEIFVVRFLLAYLCILTISPHRLFADKVGDELLMALLGITGGSLYFCAENQAVSLSYATNVSFLVCTTPLFTTLLGAIFFSKVSFTRYLLVGSLLSIMGMGMVIFNGHFVLKLNPKGDILALIAAISWAIYSILLPKSIARYGSVFVTRKVFFYGLLTCLPFFVIAPWSFPLSSFSSPVIWGNLLYLGAIASFLCFFAWNWTIKHIGTIVASNYVYLNPISTVIVSALVLNEPMTIIAYVGSSLILLGVYLANRKIASTV